MLQIGDRMLLEDESISRKRWQDWNKANNLTGADNHATV
jgi:hypothetical protein